MTSTFRYGAMQAGHPISVRLRKGGIRKVSPELEGLERFSFRAWSSAVLDGAQLPGIPRMAEWFAGQEGLSRNQWFCQVFEDAVLFFAESEDDLKKRIAERDSGIRDWLFPDLRKRDVLNVFQRIVHERLSVWLCEMSFEACDAYYNETAGMGLVGLLRHNEARFDLEYAIRVYRFHAEEAVIAGFITEEALKAIPRVAEEALDTYSREKTRAALTRLKKVRLESQRSLDALEALLDDTKAIH